MVEIKLFNKWSTEGIKVNDPGLADFICLKPFIVPKTGAKYAGSKFYKSRTINIVERLINKLMVPGHRARKHKLTSGFCTGKGHTAYNIVQRAFEIIEKKMKKNPIEVFVGAIENAATREEIVTIEYGGARYPKAVECAPQRRIDMALKLMVQGSYSKSWNSKKSIEEALADEIINAYQCNTASNAFAKKQELERQADSSR